MKTERADVDVADRDGDQSRRDWTAPVLCGYITLRGDLSLELDIYVEDALVDEAPAEPELARRLALALGVPVLYPAEEDLASAYWLATSSGESVRARLYASDDEPPVYTIDALDPRSPNFLTFVSVNCRRSPAERLTGSGAVEPRHGLDPDRRDLCYVMTSTNTPSRTPHAAIAPASASTTCRARSRGIPNRPGRMVHTSMTRR
ncbi:hypothetical protein QF034_005235 [Streptomyces africanus]|uniref:Uncharacterized protein n=1 Tax=Streptomyces africanus TaxID=231024 RepID=A0ABU0QWT1_9ACTN|nr:hypothetical protein [Streptomyces africanus]